MFSIAIKSYAANLIVY